MEKRKTEILTEMRRQMNGVVADATKAVNGAGIFSYGVLVPVIRAVAATYHPDHLLAQYLFSSDIRELKIAAVYIADTGAVTMEQAEKWKNSLATFEIADHAATGLFSKTSIAMEIARSWSRENDPLIQKAAMMTAGKQLQRIKNADTGTARECFRMAENALENENRIVLNSIAFMLVQLAKTSPENLDLVRKYVRELENSLSGQRKYTAGEIAWQLEFFNDYP